MSVPTAKPQLGGVSSCRECGASVVGEMTCGKQLGAVLAWEWQDPELHALHFLTVASYNLQHPAQFTEEAWAGLRTLYMDYLDQGLSADTLRRRAAVAARGQRILRKQEERFPVLRRWEMTIADVYLQGQAEGAAERVRNWAVVIRRGL